MRRLIGSLLGFPCVVVVTGRDQTSRALVVPLPFINALMIVLVPVPAALGRARRPRPSGGAKVVVATKGAGIRIGSPRIRAIRAGTGVLADDWVYGPSWQEKGDPGDCARGPPRDDPEGAL